MTSVRAAAGLAAFLTAVVAFWWLAGVHLSLSIAAIPGATGATALGALWLTRGMGLSVLAAQSGAAPLRASARMLAAFLCVAWPVVVLAGSAADVALRWLLLGEGLLILWAALVLVAGRALTRVPFVRFHAAPCAMLLGVAGAATVWLLRAAPLAWLAP
jgi:hypothetical protein